MWHGTVRGGWTHNSSYDRVCNQMGEKKVLGKGGGDKNSWEVWTRRGRGEEKGGVV